MVVVAWITLWDRGEAEATMAMAMRAGTGGLLLALLLPEPQEGAAISTSSVPGSALLAVPITAVVFAPTRCQTVWVWVCVRPYGNNSTIRSGGSRWSGTDLF